MSAGSEVTVRRRLGYIWPAIGMIAVIAVSLSGDRYYLHVGSMVGIILILMIGLNVIIGFGGQISLASAAFYGIGAYTSALLETNSGLNFWLATLAAMAVSIVVAVILGYPALRLRHFYLAMATMGFVIIVEQVLTQWTGLTGGPIGLSGIERPTALGFSSDRGYFVLIWIVVLIAMYLVVTLMRSRMGRSLMAVRESEPVASSLGIDPTRQKMFAFVLAGVLSAVAGSLYAHLNGFISPDSFGLNFTNLLVACFVIGGMGAHGGAVMGALILILLPEYMQGLQKYESIVFGGFLALVLILQPSGAWGLFSRVFNWVYDHLFARRKPKEPEPTAGPLTESGERT